MLFVIIYYLKEVFWMGQDDLQRDMAKVMGQLPLERQRQLLALAQTLKEAETALPWPPEEEPPPQS